MKPSRPLARWPPIPRRSRQPWDTCWSAARSMLRDAAAKLRGQSGPDAWVQTLFSLEQVTRVARELGDWSLAAEFARLMQSHDRTYAGTQYALGRASEHDGNRAAARRFY